MSVALALSSVSLWRFSLHSAALYVFSAVVILNGLCAAISMVSSQNTRKLTADSHYLIAKGWTPQVYPSVDVFLPTAGEPIEILRNTYQYVSMIQWQGELSTYVLDDGGREEVRQAAEDFGFIYLSRPNRGWMKKAGNLRFGFENSSGDLIAIFDADFCPRPDYLMHLVPYFTDPKTGIVQSPQIFDTHSNMNWVERAAGATQELFYRWVQPSRDAVEAAICVGTCAIYRRSALVEAGEFVLIEHSEDVYTGVNLYRHGYRLRYVPVQLSKGLCPSDVAGFVTQQYRWCTGSMSLLRSKEFHRVRMPLRTRVGYWSGFLYYITTAINVFLVHLPGILMSTVYPQQVQLKNYIALLPAAWVWLVLVPATFVGRWRMETLRVQMIYSFTHAVAIVHILTGRVSPWVATGAADVGKAGSKSVKLKRTVGRVSVVWAGGTSLLALGSVGYDMIHYGPTQFYLAAFLAVTYAYIALPVAAVMLPLAFARSPRKAKASRARSGIDVRESALVGEAA